MRGPELLLRWGIDVRETDPVGRRLRDGLSASNTLYSTREKQFVLRDAGRYIDYVRKQCLLIAGLHRSAFGHALPVPLKTIDGEDVTVEEGRAYYVYEYLQGPTITQRDYPQYLAQIAQLVTDYHHLVRDVISDVPGVLDIRVKINDDMREILTRLAEHTAVIRAAVPGARATVEATLRRAFTVDLRRELQEYATFTKVPCHGDIQGSNLVADGAGGIRGLIDFGGVVLEPRVFDVQVVLQHLMMGTMRTRGDSRNGIGSTLRAIAATFEGITGEECDCVPSIMLADLITTLEWLVRQPRSEQYNALIADRWSLLEWLLEERADPGVTGEDPREAPIGSEGVDR